jgi:hypothetical protein
VGYTKRESRLPTGTKLFLGATTAINDKGQILASGAYLLTPIGKQAGEGTPEDYP